MADLSPRDIQAQSFSKSPWGYKRDEVHFFLERLAKAVDEMRRERESILAETERLRERVAQLESQSDAVEETIRMARQKAELIVSNASSQAREILDKARDEAKKALAESDERLKERKHQLYRFKEIYDSYRRRFARLIEEHSNMLTTFESSLESRRAVESISELLEMVHTKRLPMTFLRGGSTHIYRRSNNLSRKGN